MCINTYSYNEVIDSIGTTVKTFREKNQTKTKSKETKTVQSNLCYHVYMSKGTQIKSYHNVL